MVHGRIEQLIVVQLIETQNGIRMTTTAEDFFSYLTNHGQSVEKAKRGLKNGDQFVAVPYSEFGGGFRHALYEQTSVHESTAIETRVYEQISLRLTEGQVSQEIRRKKAAMVNRAHQQQVRKDAWQAAQECDAMVSGFNMLYTLPKIDQIHYQPPPPPAND